MAGRATPVALMRCPIHDDGPLQWRAPGKEDRRGVLIERDERDRHAVAFIFSRILVVRPSGGRSDG